MGVCFSPAGIISFWLVSYSISSCLLFMMRLCATGEREKSLLLLLLLLLSISLSLSLFLYFYLFLLPTHFPFWLDRILIYMCISWWGIPWCSCLAVYWWPPYGSFPSLPRLQTMCDRGSCYRLGLNREIKSICRSQQKPGYTDSCRFKSNDSERERNAKECVLDIWNESSWGARGESSCFE